MRAAIIVQRLGPYHYARLSAVSAAYPDLVAIEVSPEDETYGWSPGPKPDAFKTVPLFSGRPSDRGRSRSARRRMSEVLQELEPEVVAVPGWSSSAAVSAVDWCATHRIPVVLLSASSKADFRRRWWLEWIKRRYVGLADAALVGGRLQEQYLQGLGMSPERIFVGYNAVDNDHFASGSDQARRNQTALRSRYALPQKYFLTVCRFIDKKNLPRLLRAFDRYRKKMEREDGHLVLVGDGPLRPQLELLIAELGLESSVHLPGFVQYEHLPAYYGLAAALIHPSTTEQWGLVVNEAMAAGLPVAVSERCGCVPELVDPERNGRVFDPLSEDSMVSTLLALGSSSEELSEMGSESRRIVADFGPERFAKGLAAAIRSAMSNGSSRKRLADRAALAILRGTR